MLEFHCDACRQLLKAPEAVAGKAVRCPNCKAVMTVPSPPPIEEPLLEELADEAPPSELSPGQMPWDAPAPDNETESGVDELRLAPLDSPASAPRPSSANPPVRPPLRSSAPASPPGYSGVDANASLPQFHGSRDGYHPRFFYLLFALTLIPLVFSLLGGKDDTEERIERAFIAHPEIEVRLQQARPETEEEVEDIVCDALPEGKIDGAVLPRRTWSHWILAGLTLALALAAVVALFDRGDAKFWHLPVSALFTSTFGIGFLLVTQFLAAIAPGIHLHAFRLGKLGLLLLFFYAIAMMYRFAGNTEYNFALNLLGFTFGVGLCEEATKALPVWINLRSKSAVRDWRAAGIWGLCSGVGFGIAEGVLYSGRHYNGIAGWDLYAVRFISCVGLHAVWGGTVSIMLFRNAELVEGGWEWGDWLLRAGKVLLPAMFLHGLYDTLLTFEMNGLALLTALASFALFAYVIELCYREERAAETEAS